MSYSQKPIRVGLVLSGGGAKGYAHIGALKVIEKAGVQIDYIGGTSIGAIVGGLYASGWSAAELDSMIRATDIGAAMQDKVLRRTKSFFEKEYGEHYALSLGFENFQIQLPAALSNGQDVYNLLSHWTSRVNYINDFSALPIPFLAIGTDVVTGQEIVFKNGFLPQVMRASGAFPGLLAPMWVDGRLVTDGGLVNNFPAKEVRNQGMDIIIGISVGEGLYDEEKLQSVENIITQISSYQMVRRTAEQLPYCDILLEPSIKGFGVTSFEALDTLIRAGEQAAMEVWDQLLDIAKQQTVKKGLPLSIAPASLDSICIDSVTVVDLPNFSKKNILENFPVQLSGTVSQEDFYCGIENLYGKDYFQFIDYQFSKSSDNSSNLLLEPRLKPGYKRQFKFGLHYDPVYKSSLLLNLTFRNVGLKNSTALVDIILGDQLRYNFNYLIENVSNIDVGLQSYIRYNDFRVDLPRPIPLDSGLLLKKLEFNFVDFSNEVYLHLLGNNNHVVGIGGEVKYQNVSSKQLIPVDANQPITPGDDFFLVGSAFFKHDDRNQRHFPTSGATIKLVSRIIYPLRMNIKGNQPYYNFDFNFHKIFKISNRFSLGVTNNIGITLGKPALPYYYYLGSTNQNLTNNFKPFIGLSFAQVVGSDLFGASLYGQQRIFKKHYATMSLQGAYLKSIFESEGYDWQSVYSIGLGYGIDTPLGPIEVIYGLSNEASTLSFNLGYWF